MTNPEQATRLEISAFCRSHSMLGTAAHGTYSPSGLMLLTIVTGGLAVAAHPECL